MGDVFPTFEDLFEAGDLVASLLEHPGWELVQRLVDAEILEVNRALDGRVLDSRADYAHAHGRRGGLTAVRDAAETIRLVAAMRLAEQKAKHESGAESPVGV